VDGPLGAAHEIGCDGLCRVTVRRAGYDQGRQSPGLSASNIRGRRSVWRSLAGPHGVYHRAGPIAGSGRTRWFNPGYGCDAASRIGE
jgi:hypothetical protein